MDDIPDGFVELGRLDAVLDAIAPIHARRRDDGGLCLGFRVEPKHCNPRGICHGGVWSTLADVLMGMNIGLITGLSGPTVAMTIDFLRAATVGEWVEGHARVLRKTPRLGFADCLFTAGGEPALRASAVFRRKAAPDARFKAALPDA